MDKTDWIILTKKQVIYLLELYQELATPDMDKDKWEVNLKAIDIPLWTLKVMVNKVQ